MSDPTEEPKPRVLFLNRSYWPDAEATGQLLTELCEDLADAFDVSVVAGQPNQNPSNASFRRVGVEVRRGVRIHRVPHFRWSKATLAGRAVNLASYLATSSIRAFFAKRPDVVVVETDPPLLCFLGLALRFRFGARLVVYLQDIYPDVALRLGKLPDGWIYRRLRRAMHGAYRRADLVVVLSEDMRDLLTSSGAPGDRIAVLPNWVDTKLVYPAKSENAFRRRHGLEDKFVVMYSGNLGLSQRLEHFLEAARLLADVDDVRFALVGDGATKGALQRRADELGLTNVQFFGYQPQSELAQSLSAADLHYLVLDPAIAGCLMPSKVYGILASGTPMLAAAPSWCELAQTIRDADVGFVVDFGDPGAIAERIEWAQRNRGRLEEMGRRARRLAEEQFDRPHITSRFAELLGRLVRRDPAAVLAAP
jgi:glycosyltransferase involved in cell wall biosynthesis